MNLDRKIQQFAMDIAKLTRVTSAVGWDKDDSQIIFDPTDVGGRPIYRDKWVRALAVGIGLAKAFPWLDAPVPGADPKGFCWLSWYQGDNRGLALEVHDGLYRWTQRDPIGGKKTIESDSLDDVAEAMRSVFVVPN